MVIGTDASPDGFGAWLSIDGTTTHYSPDVLADIDKDIIGIKELLGFQIQQSS